MDENEFLQSLKTDDEKFSEFTAGAEHFVRMRQQAGREEPVSVEIEKTAGNLDMAREALRRNPGVRSALIAGLASGTASAGVGAAISPPGHRLRGAMSAGVTGAAGGAMSSGISHHLNTKLAYNIDPSDRTDIPKKDFAQPHKEEAGHEGKYPIPDRQHARSALGFAKMHGDTGALEAVRAKIQQKYPDMLSEKRASAAEKLKSLGPLSLGLMGGGAAVGGIGTYLASKPREELGGKSKAEDELETQVNAHQGRPEKGLLHKMHNRTTELQHGYAQAFRDHPGKAAIMGAGAGAAGGYGLARLLDAVRGAAR